MYAPPCERSALDPARHNVGCSLANGPSSSMGSLLKRALVMAPAASASDSPNEIVPLFRVLPRRQRRASNRAEDRRHRRLDNGCCPLRRCCRCSGVVVVLCPRNLLREHRHPAATDALVVGACPAGPQATERGHVYLLGSVADGLLQACGIVDAYGGAVGGTECDRRAREGAPANGD